MPEPTTQMPVFPDEAVPVLNVMLPLTPSGPLFAVATLTEPLVWSVPSVENKLTEPPVRLRLRPASTVASLPVALVPLPAVRRTRPARPPVAAPEPDSMAPALPCDADPELKLSAADEPLVPAFATVTRTKPLVVAAPSPVADARQPPVPLQVRPATVQATPPVYAPRPTRAKIEPPRPPVAAPVPKTSSPELPRDVVPVLNRRLPLAPRVPALGVYTRTLPEEDEAPPAALK